MIELKIFLVRHALHQADLAGGTGLSEVSVSGLMTGRVKDPKKSTIDKILGYCRTVDPSVTYEQLFFDRAA